jgi:hypothetical protein
MKSIKLSDYYDQSIRSMVFGTFIVLGWNAIAFIVNKVKETDDLWEESKILISWRHH